MNLELEREQIIQVLCQQYAQDALTTEELESRLEAAYRAKDLEELRALTRGLPALRSRAGPAPADIGRPPGATAEKRILSILSEVKKSGEWEVARYVRAVSLLGSLELDFREARILPGFTTIEVSATLAEVRIIVPPGLNVEFDGNAILGEFTNKVTVQGPENADAPTLVITGLSVLADVSVQMRLPGESAMEALKRQKGTRAGSRKQKGGGGR